MKHIPSRRRAAAGITATVAAIAAATGTASAHTARHHRDPYGSGHAVFVQTDGLSGNAIDVYRERDGGRLELAGAYPTGGEGGQTAGSTADHLSSQGALTYDAAAHELFAVNAGSDTLTTFSVDGDHLTRLQVIPSGGSFPVSVTVDGDLVYALNGLGAGDISGFRLHADGTLTPLPGSTRTLGLDPDATPQFVNTPGQVAFSPDGRQLLVTTKANTNAIDVFAINAAGRPSATPVVNTEAGAVPFGLAFEPGGTLAVAEAGTDSIATFALHGDGTLSAISSVSTGEKATCWLVAAGSDLFAGNAASGSESVITGTPALALTQTEPTDAGTIDAAPSTNGRYLYVQAGVAGTIDEYTIDGDTLTRFGTVTAPGGVGQEGIAAS